MEQVVLLTESGHRAGVTDKASVHHADTPLHLAFSCYVFNLRDQLLLTQRALTKKTWPGVWTNSCCGHPAPDEALTDSVRRRLRDELSLVPTELTVLLPGFRYRAVMSDGTVENEMCPVFRGYLDGDPQPDPDEVEDFRWVDWDEFTSAVLAGRQAVSPWCAQQVEQLVTLGGAPRYWPAGDSVALPPAARLVD